MRVEYLIFHMLVFLMPFVLAFEKNMNFYQHIRYVALSIILVAIPYVVWDVLVTNSHWWFNESYHLNITLFHLPFEEIFFFFTVPFAGLFIWEVMYFYSKQKNHVLYWLLQTDFRTTAAKRNFLNSLFILILVPLSIILCYYGKEYAALVSISGLLLLLTDRMVTNSLLTSRRFLLFSLVLTMLTMIFNGYLTARPVVLYNDSVLLGIRVFTIPLEDFFYGLTLLGWNIVLYEKFLQRKSKTTFTDENQSEPDVFEILEREV